MEPTPWAGPLRKRKKTLALVPSVREQDCPHAHVPYRGRVPCTGPRICSMCGATPQEIERGA